MKRKILSGTTSEHRIINMKASFKDALLKMDLKYGMWTDYGLVFSIL
ncbi:MAG: hypothetical protein IPM85_06815 [Chitinophagaceae bacterium]|nr:hypothetical protein [Chitinophagaceae bacterium]